MYRGRILTSEEIAHSTFHQLLSRIEENYWERGARSTKYKTSARLKALKAEGDEIHRVLEEANETLTRRALT